jgi:hypothetical protein
MMAVSFHEVLFLMAVMSDTTWFSPVMTSV